MNWKSAKTILIIIFICTNLFLLATIFMSTERTSIITDDIQTSTVMVLKNNGISINPDIIPRKTKSVPLVRAKNIIDDSEKFAEGFVGTITEAQENIYKGENGEIVISGDYFEFTPANPKYPELTKKINLQNVSQIAASILKQSGFSGDAEYNAGLNGDTYTITATKKANGLYQFNSTIILELTETGVNKISGRWFPETEELSDVPDIKSVTSVLIDYISLNERIIGNEEIIKLDFGYTINEKPNDYHKETTLVPAWKITLSDKREYVLSAIDSQVE